MRRKLWGWVVLLALCGCQAASFPMRPSLPQTVESSSAQAANLSIRIALPRETQALPSNTQSIRVLLRKSGLTDRTATVDTGSPTTVTFSALPPGSGYTLYAASYSGMNGAGTMLSWGTLPLTLASGLNSASFGLSVAVRSGTGVDDLVAGPAGNQAQQFGAQRLFTSMNDLNAEGSLATSVEVFYPGQYAYLGQFGTLGTGNGQLNGPDAVGVDSLGNVYVVDRNNHRIQKFDGNFAFVRGWGQGTIWTAAQSPPAIATGSLNGAFDDPNGMLIDRDNNLWICEVDNHRIQKFDANGNFLMGIGQGGAWYAGTAAPAPTAGSANGAFTVPSGMALAQDGNLWIADAGNHRVQKVSPNGKFLMAIGNGTTWSAPTPAPAPIASDSAGYFNMPSAQVVDAQGNLYVTDAANQRIQKFSASGAYLAQWPTGSSYPISIAPGGVILAGAPNLGASCTVGVFTPSGTRLSQFGNNGTGNGQFNGNIRPMAFLADNSVLVGDRANNRVQRFRGVNMLDIMGGLRLTGHRQPDTPVFANSGTYDTPPVDAGTSTTWGSIYWNVALQPANTGVATAVATSSNGLSWGTWVPVAGSSAVGNNSANLSGITGRYLKVRLTLLTTDTSVSPEVQDVGVTY